MPGLCERRGGVHSGGRYAQMCTFSRPCACEYQVLSGSPARMLKKRQVLTGFFFTGLAQSRAHQRRSVSGTVWGIMPGCVRRAFFVRSGGGVCVLLCVSTSSFVNILRRSRLHHGFIMALQLIAKGQHLLAMSAFISIQAISHGVLYGVISIFASCSIFSMFST